MLSSGKRGQVALFVILALVIVAVIAVFFLFRGNFLGENIPAEFRPVYSLYEGCIAEETENALALISTQGGRIDVGEFVPGSEYAPFSTHLNFAGSPVPYWFSLSGNNILRESVPTRAEMEEEISDFVASRINECDFSSFYAQGFYIDLGEPAVTTTISEDKVDVIVNSNVVVQREEESARRSEHSTQVNSKLGKFHNMAVEIYQKQRNEAFLEEYAVDVIRLYAPVDGVEIQCSPAIWKTSEVVDEIHSGLAGNIRAIKLQGDYYDLQESTDDYFVVEHEVDEAVSFTYSQEWPSKIEIHGEGVSQELMIAQPVGNQEGMGIMGFCYTPYHFVYDVSFPVMVQIYDGFEFFQFPVTVIIEGNLPRVADKISLDLEREEETFNICNFAEGEVNVNTYDLSLNPVEANISYQCFDRTCSLGQTEISGSDASLNSAVPVCVNGVLVANADGYAEERVFFSSNSESRADIILEREYEIEIEFLVAGQVPSGASAIIHFAGADGKSASALLPETNSITLKEGLYNVSMHVYGDSDVVIPAATKVECIDVASGGIGGLFGGTKEECVEIEYPAVNIDNALIGGGETSTYILESELASGKIIIDGSELPAATSLEQLQYNFEAFESLGVDLRFS